MHPPLKLLHLLVFLLIPASGLFAQSVTSSGIGGVVRTSDGDPASGVSVFALHLPSGSQFTTTSNNEGRYNIGGMRVGGPYRVRFTAPNGDESVIEDVFLNLQQQRTINTRVRPSGQVFELEAFEVQANQFSSTFNENKQGSSTIIDADSISRIPTVSRSINDIVRLDPRMAAYDEDSGTISAGGKNTRYNSLLIDGVPTNDSFGLSDSGLPALKQPFSLEAIAEVSVQLSPYSVENAGFTGAAISAVTKSGTNEFQGSFFAFYRDESMVGELEDQYWVNRNETLPPGTEEETIVPIDDFREYTAGFTVGGPIIRDKLFFFALYESVEETVTQDPGTWFPEQDELDRILTMINDVYQFDPGELVEPESLTRKDDKYLLKLDWNISNKHRLTARYQLTDGQDPRYPNSGFNSVAFTSHNYVNNFELQDYAIELFSNWSSTLQTEIQASFKEYNQFRALVTDPLPEVEISSVDGIDGDPGSVWFGSEAFSQANNLTVETTTFRSKLSWLLGDHAIKAGIQYENFANRNEFIPNRFGSWFFRNGVRSFENAVEPGNLENYSLTLPAPGQSGISEWEMAIASAYVEDNWKATPDLTLNFGLRIDYPLLDDTPPLARGSSAGSFEEVFGLTNTSTLDGNYVVQPRLGFNYAFDEDRTVQLRGGGGLFFGTAPHVWISSIYVNNGNSQESYYASVTQTPAFSADPFNPPVPDAVNSRVNVDLIDEDFEMPSEWKSNLALDIQVLPNMVLTTEAAFSWTNKDIHYIHENLKPTVNFLTGTSEIADGRTEYDNAQARSREPGYRDIIRLTNTDKGYSRQFTARLEGSFLEGSLDYNLGYTYTRAKNVNDGLASTAYSNWTNNVGFDPNDEILGRSRYETTNRVVASVTYTHTWSDRHQTSISVFYDGRNGRPFSFVMGDGGPTDINNDGNTSNDLFYVPSGVDDPRILWGGNNSAENLAIAAEWMAAIEGIDGLAQYKGQVVPRNSGTAPWIHQFDLGITHEITLFDDHKLEIIFAIENFGNLLNDAWGLERRVRGANGNLPIMTVNNSVRVVDGERRRVYAYYPNLDNLNDEEWYSTRTFSSRWAMQLGVRYKW